VRGSVELASPVDVERSSFIFKAMVKSRPNCDKNGCMCKKQRKDVTLEEKLSVIKKFTLRVFVLRDDFSERINRVVRGFAVYPSLAPGSSSPRRTRERDSYVYGHLKGE
jgi:hypothetical protein